MFWCFNVFMRKVYKIKKSIAKKNYLSIQSNCGFTLMEVLVATSLFALVSLASLSIYISTLKASQKSTAFTRIQQEMQIINQVLVKKIRTSRLNYDYTGYAQPLINPETELALVDEDGNTFVFKKITNSLAVSVNGGADKIIPSTNVKIDDLKFYINPTTNPFSLDTPPTSQPYVTILISVSSRKGAQAADLVVQQTVPQRAALVE